MSCKFIKYIFLWVSLWLPIFLFEEIFRSQFEVYELTGGVYREAPFIYIALSGLLAAFYSFIPKHLRKFSWYKLLVVVVFCIFYVMMCILVAWDYRINFGTTWLMNDVFFELVATHWYFYTIGFVGLVLHSLQILEYSKNKALSI